MAREVNPGPVKYALSVSRRGFSAVMRLPMTPIGEATALAVRRTVDLTRSATEALRAAWLSCGETQPANLSPSRLAACPPLPDQLQAEPGHDQKGNRNDADDDDNHDQHIWYLRSTLQKS